MYNLIYIFCKFVKQLLPDFGIARASYRHTRAPAYNGLKQSSSTCKHVHTHGGSPTIQKKGGKKKSKRMNEHAG